MSCSVLISYFHIWFHTRTRMHAQKYTYGNSNTWLNVSWSFWPLDSHPHTLGSPLVEFLTTPFKQNQWSLFCICLLPGTDLFFHHSHIFSIGLKSGLWEDHSKSSTLVWYWQWTLTPVFQQLLILCTLAFFSGFWWTLGHPDQFSLSSSW